jgi:hypothetical protein
MPKHKARRWPRFTLRPPALRYVGNGAWVRGIPARDLSSAEVAALGIDAVALCQARPDLYTEAASAVAADEQSADSGKETF